MSKTRTNVVLLFVDDLGIGDVSAFNKEAKFQTPNIDKLAERGMMFTDSHATSALCTPSRYGLLTGRYNWRSRLKDFVVPGDSDTLIEKDRKTIAHLLKDYGYNTAAVGKWHLGLEWAFKKERDYVRYGLLAEEFENKNPTYQKGREYFGNGTNEQAMRGVDIDYSKPITYGPLEYGFDYFFGTSASLDQGPFVVIENDKVLFEPIYTMGNANISRVAATNPKAIEPGVAAPEHSPYHLPDEMQSKVIEKMTEFLAEDAPFFMYYPNHLVHGPIIPHVRFRGKSGIGDYGDFVLQLDSYVGEIIELLDEHQEFDNTIFIFTSDNGVSSIVDLEGLKAKGHDSSMGYRGHKMHIWEGGHREPTIVSWPQQIKAGTVSNQMVSHSDLYATLADLLGADIEDDTAEDSYSNLPLWQSKEEPVRQDIIHSAANGGFSIRRDFWKLILVEDGGMNLFYERKTDIYKQVYRPTELYDLRDDVSETTNVIDHHPELVEELTQALAEYVKKGRSTAGEPQANQPDLPTGDWEQLAWMKDYQSYIKEVNKDYEADILDKAASDTLASYVQKNI